MRIATRRAAGSCERTVRTASEDDVHHTDLTSQISERDGSAKLIGEIEIRKSDREELGSDISLLPSESNPKADSSGECDN